jgi:hypothetical protein
MADAVSLALYASGRIAAAAIRRAREVRRWAVGWFS